MEVLCRRCDRRDSQSVVVIPQARLKEIGKLDQWLQTAAREGGPQAVQAVCATQWNLCLPLLQHNLRKCIKTPLLRVAQALEETQRFSSFYIIIIMALCACPGAFRAAFRYCTHVSLNMFS